MAEKLEIKKHHALSGWPMLIGWIGMLVFAFHSCTHMVGAGDTWVAMACGRHFYNHKVDTVEPFSANSHKAGPTEKEIQTWPKWAQGLTDMVGINTVRYWHPTGWLNQNWLTHYIFYWVTHESPFADADTFSFNSLIYWKFALYIITIICVYKMGRLLGVNPALSAAFACFALFTGRSFLDVRPAGFSNLCVALYLLILLLTTHRNILYIWLIVPLAIFWCNVHGGYIYVFIMLVPFFGLNFLASISTKWFVTIGKRGLYHTAGAGIAALLAVIVFNPFHLTNLTHTFVISISEHAEMWRNVNEWHPAFEWKNPVGTGYPYLILVILTIIVPLFWLSSRVLKPRLLTAPKKEIKAQEKFYKISSNIFGYTAICLAIWLIFLSLALIDINGWSFFYCIVFASILLASIYYNIHFIYAVVLFAMLVLWKSNAKTGYEGGYIYTLAILPGYVVIHTIASLLSEKIKHKTKDIIFVAGSALAAIILMIIIFKPLKVVTPWWSLESLLYFKKLFIPIFTNNARPNYRYLLAALYIINIASIIVWLIIPYLRSKLTQPAKNINSNQQDDSYQLPKIDLAIMTITIMTVYMAYRSRRFIPIAGIAMSPVIAMCIDQMVRTISAARNFYRKNRLIVSPMSVNFQRFFIIIGLLIVVGFGSWWTIKFKWIYLDPWPSDAKLSSVFMRMTASDAKPFYALKFIKDNKLKGKMFNYWTEGGFIAWGQEPDPKTGKTPLQLFMDGRAQAAYDPRAYQVWSSIMAGGPVVKEVSLRGRKLNSSDYIKIGKWIGNELKKHNVWVILMPAGQFEKVLVKSIQTNHDWPAVFINNKQKIFIDVTTEQGKKLMNGIFTGETVYPDEFSRNLIIAHNLFLYGKGNDAKKEGLKVAIKAFELFPSQAPIHEILYATNRYSFLHNAVKKFCESVVNRFIENKDKLIKIDGYHQRIVAAINAADYLRRTAKGRKDIEREQFYEKLKKDYIAERKDTLKYKRW